MAICRNLLGLFLFLLIVGTNISCAQQVSFSVKEVPSKYRRSHIIPVSTSFDGYIDLTKYLPTGYSKKGDVDYTKYLQKGLDENRKVIFPNFPVLISDVGLTIKSNSELIFDQNSLLKLKSSNLERYEILRLHNVSNIKITDAKIQGDREGHLGTTGEWGMGIAIRGNSKNITIENANITDCWGDGIYLGHLRNVAPENIILNNPVIDRCRRNGISITTGKNVKVTNAVISNIFGTAPQSGIVIEPSNSKAVFHDIAIIKPIIYNVGETGLKIAGFEKLLGNPNAVSDIVVDHPILDESVYNMFIGRIRDEKTIKGASIGGRIKIINPTMLNAKTNSFIIRKQSKRGPKINIEGMAPKVKTFGKNEAKEVVIK